MGISSMPAPKDSVVAYLLYNTAVSIAILADMVRAALVFLGLPVPPSAWEDGDDQLAAIAAAGRGRGRGGGGPEPGGQVPEQVQAGEKLQSQWKLQQESH
uniref:Uncharacterized protein n=1 Tax=Oryza barthii TaxID=65489 RepID=A0A0D3H1N7_9ORYZ